MKFPEGWTLTHTPTEQDSNLRTLYRNGVAVAGITYEYTGGNAGQGFWRYFALPGAGATYVAQSGSGYAEIDTAAKLAMRDLWTPTVDEPDTSDMDDYEYDQAARLERLSW